MSLLGKLSILLDTDTDSLLTGDVIHHEKGWHGVLILEKSPYGIGSDTIVYDKPLVYYLLSYFLLVGIKSICVVCSKKDELFICSELLNEDPISVDICFSRNLYDCVNKKEFMNCDNIMLVFGKSIIYGVDQTRFFQRAMANRSHLTLLTLPKGTRDRASSVYFNKERKIVSKDDSGYLKTQYDYYDIPILFSPAKLFRNCFEENDMRKLASLFRMQDVYIEPLDRGFVEIRIHDWDSVLEASDFIRIVQRHCGMIIYCIEEVAWRRGLIDRDLLRQRGEKKRGTAYGDYILRLCE